MTPEGPLLHVLYFTLTHDAQIPDLLRWARHAGQKRERLSILLFCDLQDADAAALPDDTPMLRRLQSGVMAMNARGACEFLLLARRREWDDASRAYLGAGRKSTCRETVARLLRDGESDAVFDAATVSPASLKGRFSSVLFSSLSLACTPDTPKRMADALERSASGCVCARVRERNGFPQTAFSRLCSAAPFALSPLRCMQKDRLLGKGPSCTDMPAMYTLQALIESLNAPAARAQTADGCFFVRRLRVTLPDFFREHRRLCLHESRVHALLPVLQCALLFLSAAAGLPWLTALALLPAALWALVHPRRLPGVLLRLALLPLTVCVSLDALLCRMLARSKLVRLRIPDALVTPQGCALFGAALLPIAFYSAKALVFLLPICLLWLAAPLIIPSLDAPTIERIPLSSDQLRQMRTLSESAFFDAAEAAGSPAFRMLSACAGCMLGLLEPDEAARQAQAQLDSLGETPLAAHDLAALLAAAQYLRERMGDCDAALRALPADIEQRALSLPLQPSSGRLRILLSAARGELSSPQALDWIARSETPEPVDLLFLPLQSIKHTPIYPVSLPLTHPHTFLQKQLSASDTTDRPANAVMRFLFLTASALGHPFHAMLERSPIAGPYMPLLSI